VACAVVSTEYKLAAIEAEEEIEARILLRYSRPMVSSSRESNRSRWQSHFMLFWSHACYIDRRHMPKTPGVFFWIPSHGMYHCSGWSYCPRFLAGGSDDRIPRCGKASAHFRVPRACISSGSHRHCCLVMRVTTRRCD
jgi:hypothetical protein